MARKSIPFRLFVLGLSFLVLLFAGCDDSGDGADGDLSPDGDADATPDGDEPSPDGDENTPPDGDKETPDGDMDAEAEAETEIEAEAPRWPACDPAAATQTVTFVHVNDLHSHYSPRRNTGMESPVARLVGYVKQAREQNPYTLFTNGGDDHEKGSVAEPLSMGYATKEIVHAMNFDVRVVGNHDFAWGPEELIDYVNDPHALVVASNTTYVGTNPDDWKAVKYGVLEVGCVKIGFFGMVGKPWNEKNEQYTGDFFPGGDFRMDFGFIDIAEEIVGQHRAEVDLMVMISHLGTGLDEAIALSVEGIDVILGGHSHTVMGAPQIIPPYDTIMIQSGSGAEFLTHLDITVDLDSRKVTGHRHELVANVYTTIEADAEMQATVEDVMGRYAPDYDTALGQIKARKTENGVRDLTAIAAVATSDADAAIINPWAVWGVAQAGDFTQQDMMDCYKIERQPAGTPSWNAYYLATISGADLQTLASSIADPWAYVGPDAIDPDRTYKLGFHKFSAYNPEEYLPEGVAIQSFEFECETWELLDRYARQRTGECLFVDVDESLSDCTPAR